MKNFAFLVCILVSLLAYSQEVQEQHQRAEIHFQSLDDLITFGNLGIPADHGINYADKFVLSDFSLSEIAKARQAGFYVEILIEDSKTYFLQQNQMRVTLSNGGSCSSFYNTPVNFNFGSMGGYYTYQEFLEEIEAMHDLYPNLITAPQNIGDFLTEGTPDASTTPPIGGNPIKWLKISDSPNYSNPLEPQILYNSITHAREPTSLSQLIFYMWYLLENYETDPEIKKLVDQTEMYFVPVVNPDGYLYNEKTDPQGGGLWRKNRKDTDGVDVNRNYDYYIDGDSNNNIWGGEGTSADPTSNIYHGIAPFSEVESQAMKWFCEQHNFVLGLNNHSFGNGIFLPFGYTASAFTPDHELYLDFNEELTSKNGYFYRKTLGIAGTANDFMYGTAGTHDKIFSITPEIGDQFWLPMNEIESVCKDMVYLNITAAKMANGTANIVDTSPYYAGNDGYITQTFRLQHLALRNEGNYTVQMNPISDNIIWHGGTDPFNNLAPLETGLGAIDYVVAGGTASGEAIVFELIVRNGSFSSRILVEKKFGLEAQAFMDPGNNVTDNFEATSWSETTEDFVSPPSAITDSPNSEYLPNEDSSIALANEIDLTNATGASVSFYAKWDLETYLDYVQFEVSTDGGATWTPQCGLYTREGGAAGVQPQGEPVYHGFQEDWVLEYIDLSDYVGSNLTVRFQLGASNFIQRDGFYFDDLTINIVDDEVLGTNAFSQSEISIFPNPVSNQLQIITPFQSFVATVYDVHGQLIAERTFTGKIQAFDYSKYASGIYFMRIISEENTETFKIIKQ